MSPKSFGDQVAIYDIFFTDAEDIVQLEYPLVLHQQVQIASSSSPAFKITI